METSPYIDLSIPPVNHSLAAQEGIKFLFETFPYAFHTLQFIGKKIPLKPAGKSISQSPVFIYKPSEQAKALQDCLKFNKSGYDIFFMVNEGDGITYPSKRTPRSQLNIKVLSKLFIDTDSCPIGKVTAYLTSLGLLPHISIESSPGRYHLYFLINPALATPENIFQWQTIQRVIHRLGDFTLKSPSNIGMDATMHDYSKVLRIPGFMHCTKKTLVKFSDFTGLSVNETLAREPYTLNEIFHLVNAQEYLSYNQSVYGQNEPSVLPDLTAADIIPIGDRFNVLQALSMHLANTESPKAGYKIFCDFIASRLDNSDSIYWQDKQPTIKAENLFKSALKKIKYEDSLRVKTSLDTATVPSETSSANINESLTAWHLPDEFYLSAPNGFGAVVRHVMDNSLYPCASLAFGTFLTGLSILKSYTHLTPTGSSPALYTLHVAPPGYGKSDPMMHLQNMFASLGIGKLISNEIRSDRGLYNHLDVNQGLGLFVLDEVAPLLKAIQHKDANVHHSYIAKALLFLYSAGTMKGISLGKLSSSNSKKGEKELVIDNPMLAVLGYTVPEQFKTLFTRESITTGLFQRFIPIIPEITLILANTEADRQTPISSELFSIPAATFLHTQEINEDGSSPLQTVSRIRMKYTPEAYSVFHDLCRRYREKYTRVAQDESECHLAGLYSRLVEQVERIATVLSQDEIGLSTLEYAIQFMESKHHATLSALASGDILKSEGSRNIEKGKILVATFKKMCDSRDEPVWKSELFKHARWHFKNMRDFEEVLQELIATGVFVLTQSKNVSRGRPGLTIQLA